MDNLNRFLGSKPFLDYSLLNPISSNEIKDFLISFYEQHPNLSGIEALYKNLSDNTQGTNPPPLKWFNYFSQIRCVNYLLCKNVQIDAVECLKGSIPLDFKIKDGRFGDVKSFSTIDERIDDPYSLDEYVIQYFAEKKLKPVFEKQKTDLVVIDNIFSHNSKHYGLLDYFISFVHEPEIKDRYELIQKYLGEYLPKMLYISFIDSITTSPLVKYSGEEFNDLGIS